MSVQASVWASSNKWWRFSLFQSHTAIKPSSWPLPTSYDFIGEKIAHLQELSFIWKRVIAFVSSSALINIAPSAEEEQMRRDSSLLLTDTQSTSEEWSENVCESFLCFKSNTRTVLSLEPPTRYWLVLEKHKELRLNPLVISYLLISCPLSAFMRTTRPSSPAEARTWLLMAPRYIVDLAIQMRVLYFKDALCTVIGMN
jgi:hypothetical protein